MRDKDAVGRRANAWIQLLVVGLASLIGGEEKMHPPRLPWMRHEPTVERLEDDVDLVLNLPDEGAHAEPPINEGVRITPKTGTLSFFGQVADPRSSGDPTA